MNRVEHALCRIREKLNEESFVTLGVGCVVKHESLAASLGWKCPNLLVTSVDVLSPQHLASDRIFTAEFLGIEKKGLELFELKPAAEFCKSVCGRSLREENGSHPTKEQLTVISVEPLDKRGFLKRMVKKNSLQTSRPIDCFDFEYYESEIEDGIFCNVIREFGSNAQEFESRTYKFKFSESRKVYLLEDFLHRDVELEEQSFPSDQILAGGVVFSKQGLYLGCLAYNASQIMPSFIPDTHQKIQAEPAEENPEGEEELENKAEGLDVDTKKGLQIDENENKDLHGNDLELGTENNEEQAGAKETQNELIEQEQLQNMSDNVQVESQESEKETNTEHENQETDNNKEMSQDELFENEQKTEITDHSEEKPERSSDELEFVISVDHNESEENGKVTEEREITENEKDNEEIEKESQENEKDSEKTENDLDEATNDIIGTEDIVLNSKEDDIEEQNENLEKITSEIEHEENEQENIHATTTPDEQENKNQEEQLNVVTNISQDNTIEDHKDNIGPNTDVTQYNVVSEPGNVAIATEVETESRVEGGTSLDDTAKESVEVVERESTLERNELVETEACVTEPSLVDTTVDEATFTETSGSMETFDINQETDLKTDRQFNTSEVTTSLQDNVKDEPSENVSHEDEEGNASKEEEVEVESSLPQQSSSTEETKEQDIIGETIEEDQQISSEQNQIEEIGEQNSTKDNLESQEPSEPSSKQDESLMIQEETMSIKLDRPDGTQKDIKRDEIELEKTAQIELGEPLEPDDLLTTKITNNPKALDDLAVLLDTEYQHGGVSSWHDLAELLAIPKEAYDHCLSFSKPSPTEDLMVFLSSTKPQFSISDLKDSLRSISRPDVVHIIDRYIARAIISDETVIQGVIEQEHIDLLGELALKLDRGHHNWKLLARQLEVPSRISRNFGSHQRHNSSFLMLKYLPIFDPDLIVDSLKDSCRAVGLNDLAKFLDASGVPGEDAIMDILEDTDFIDEVTDKLNEEDENGPHWKKLGRELKIPEEKFSIFEPSKMNSPTKMLLQSIAQCEPDITVDELILALVAMKRHDVIEMLGKHFRNSDIRSILEENNCLPPQPEPRSDDTDEKDEEESTA